MVSEGSKPKGESVIKDPVVGKESIGTKLTSLSNMKKKKIISVALCVKASLRKTRKRT
jgi:hypothetical protein